MTDDEIAIGRAKIEADHQAIKLVIQEIEFIQELCQMLGNEPESYRILECLRHRLGSMFYKNWPSKE